MTGNYELMLTAQDLERVAAVRDSWVATGLSTDAVSEERVWPLVDALYAAHGLPVPALKVRMSSPVGAVCAAAICRRLHGEQWGPLRDEFGLDLWRELHHQISYQLGGRPDHQAGDLFMDAIRSHLYELQLPDRFKYPLVDLALDWLGAYLGTLPLHHDFDGQLDSRLRAWLGCELGGKLEGRLTDQLWGRLGDELTKPTNYMLGPWVSARELAEYELALPLAGLPRSQKRDALEAVLREAGWFIPMRGAAVISDRPCRLELDAQPLLHSGDGMALAWRDGCGFHYWHGRPVPGWVISKPTVTAISAEPNAEIRRCAIESLGWEVFVAEAGAALIGTAADPGNPGHDLSLYEVPERLWGSRVNLLIAVNGTTERDGTRRRYGLTTPAEIRDPVAAAAWTYQLTKDQYAACQRRA